MKKYNFPTIQINVSQLDGYLPYPLVMAFDISFRRYISFPIEYRFSCLYLYMIYHWFSYESQRNEEI